MRVAQAVGVQLAAALDQHAVGARRQRQQLGVPGQRLDQQGALGGAVEHAEVAAGVAGDEALAALFRLDLADRAVAQAEVADVFQARFAIGVTGHEPLVDTALGVADQQRDAAEQLGAGGDLGARILKQLVAAVEALAAQVEDVGLGAAVDHVQPLLARVEVQRLDRVGDLRQGDALLRQRGLAGEHVLFAGQRQQQRLGADRAGEHQAVAVVDQADVLQRAPLLVERQRLLAIGIGDLRGDDLPVVRVGDLVLVLEHQHRAVGQAQRHLAVAGLVLADGGDLGAGRQRQADAPEFGAVPDGEEHHLAAGADAHADLVLFLQGQQQRLVGLLQPGRALHLAGRQLGALEQRQYHVGEVEEDQGDGHEHRQAAHQHVPAGQTVLEGTQAALALEFGRIEINPHRRGIGGHGGSGQVVHGLTLAVPYDRKMTAR
ncbi:hypothetical protein D9M68_570470 [compost metagenome]